MSKVSLNYPVVGQKDSTEEPKVTTALKAIEEFLNGAKIESTDNIKVGGITEASLAAAVKTLLNTKSAAALTFTNQVGATYTAASGDLVLMQKDASVVTLPAATVANRIVCVWASVTVTSMTVQVPAAEKIFGDFLSASGVTSFKLAGGQHVLLQADGSEYLILAGEPRREQTYAAVKTYTKVEGNAGVTPSTTREAYVAFSSETNGLEIGGVLVVPGPMAYLIPAGVQWKTAATGGPFTVSTLLR